MKQLSQVFLDINTMSKNTEFIPTGFEKLDIELDGGFIRKELIVLGGFTGAGKSFLAGQMLYSAAKEGYKCAYFSLEISTEMVVARLIGQESNLKPTRIMAGLLDEYEQDDKIRAQAKLSLCENNLFFFDDLYYLQEITKVIRASSLDFIVIDFIQNVMEKGDEYEKLSKVALELQKLAKEKDCCILVISQLSNEAHKTGAMEYKGSGSIATVCDLGMFVVRDTSTMDRMVLSVKKNRRGRSNIDLPLISIYPGGRINEFQEIPNVKL